MEPVNLGIQEAMRAGALAGYEMVDLRAVLHGGSYHVEDSSEMAFKIAASMAFKEAALRASPILLEPIMSVEVVLPEEYIGTTMGDLNNRRGRIEGMEHRAAFSVIHAIVPLSNMLGYWAALHASTQGRADHSMRLIQYAPCSSSESGGNEAGVTANKPKGPKPKSGSAAAKLDHQSD